MPKSSTLVSPFFTAAPTLFSSSASESWNWPGMEPMGFLKLASSVSTTK